MSKKQKKQITVRLAEDVVDWVTQHGADVGRSFSQVVAEALDSYRRSFLADKVVATPVYGTTVSSARFLATFEFAVPNHGHVDDTVDQIMSAVTDVMRRGGSDDAIGVTLHKLAPLNAEITWTLTHAVNSGGYSTTVPIYGSVTVFGANEGE